MEEQPELKRKAENFQKIVEERKAFIDKKYSKEFMHTWIDKWWRGSFLKEYYLSDWWKWLSSEHKKRGNYTCENCGQIGGKLESHHRSYEHVGTMNEFEDLQLLCNFCRR